MRAHFLPSSSQCRSRVERHASHQPESNPGTCCLDPSAHLREPPDHSRQRGLPLGTVTVGTAIHSFVHSSACIKCLLCSSTAPAPGRAVTKLPPQSCRHCWKRAQEQTRNTLIPSHQGAESRKETEGAWATLEKSGLSERGCAWWGEASAKAQSLVGGGRAKAQSLVGGGQRKGPEPGRGRPAQRPRAWWGEATRRPRAWSGEELGDFSTRPPGLEQRGGARRSYKPGQAGSGKDFRVIFWEIWEAPGGFWVGSHVL